MGQGFFDVHAKLHQATARSSTAPAGTGEVLTVLQLTNQIDRAIKKGIAGTVQVQGELSNYKAHGPSGNHYFTLKDSGACIECAMFRSDATTLRFRPEDGMELLATGRVSVYAQRGKYQLYVNTLSPVGQGALELALQQLRSKLDGEGLFAAERKRELPKYPLRLALVTSRATAALQDMLKVFSRFPWLKVSLFHVPVQGDGAAEKIADAIQLINQHRARLGIEVIVLGRGGGSLEDLWEFNEEIVARSISTSTIPVVTGIGHEIDTSIADLCADYFAHTPTEAAQVVTAQWRTVSDELDGFSLRLRRALRAKQQASRQKLVGLERHEFFRRPLDLVGRLRQRLDDRERGIALAISRRLHSGERLVAELHTRLERHRPTEALPRRRQRLGSLQEALTRLMAQRLSAARNQLTDVALRLRGCDPIHRIELIRQRVEGMQERIGQAARQGIARRGRVLDAWAVLLNALNPEKVLARGYSITTLRKGGRIVKSAETLQAGDRLQTRFAEGTIDSVVQDRQQLPLFE